MVGENVKDERDTERMIWINTLRLLGVRKCDSSGLFVSFNVCDRLAVTGRWVLKLNQ